jgi:ABC-type amino acid transport substrate-binding protein
MSYLTLALLMVATGLLALLGGRWLAARPAARPTPSPAAAAPPLPSGPLVVGTLAGHPLPPTYANGQGSAATFQQLRHLAADRQGTFTWLMAPRCAA